MLAGTMVLAGCSTHAPTTIPTAQRSGQGWVVTRTVVAAQLLQACPDPIADQAQQLFAPSRAQIDQLEARLATFDAGMTDSFDRQYIGLRIDDVPLIYLRGFPASDHRSQDPSRELVSDCTSGFEVLFDPASGRFSDLHRFDMPADYHP